MISAVVVVGAIWILTGGLGRDVLGAARLPVVAALLVIPFLADAKQVILALPAIVLASSWRVGRLQFLVRGALVAGAVVALFALAPAGNTAERYLEENQQGQGGKQATALFLWHKLDSDPASLAFGKGPAETVSRAAFMTTPLVQRADSPLAVLDLKPAALAVEAQSIALEVSGGGRRPPFNSGTSSALGVLGDLGIFGLLAYAGLLLSLFLRLRAETSAEGVAAASGFALFLVLGFVFDWWEQPPFGVVIGVLAGLSLSESQFRRTRTKSRAGRLRCPSRQRSLRGRLLRACFDHAGRTEAIYRRPAAMAAPQRALRLRGALGPRSSRPRSDPTDGSPRCSRPLFNVERTGSRSTEKRVRRGRIG